MEPMGIQKSEIDVDIPPPPPPPPPGTKELGVDGAAAGTGGEKLPLMFAFRSSKGFIVTVVTIAVFTVGTCLNSMITLLTAATGYISLRPSMLIDRVSSHAQAVFVPPICARHSFTLVVANV